jgi:hypothetical protein
VLDVVPDTPVVRHTPTRKGRVGVIDNEEDAVLTDDKV